MTTQSSSCASNLSTAMRKGRGDGFTLSISDENITTFEQVEDTCAFQLTQSRPLLRLRIGHKPERGG